ncbi:hypothetical protein VTJ83DRAFT_3543 [Remersonia thermophila]|uniref:GPI inositol-deacylase n=1 Tax=Remersonia thermophila TaxID=72144 RepID=A0ABR4DGG7_9PEZI
MITILGILSPPRRRPALDTRLSLSRQSSRARGFLQRMLSRQRTLPHEGMNAHGNIGLNLLFCPTEPLIDLIFVHSLGGGSTKTWCYSEDPAQFWPKEWLPREQGFRNVRIHSFGYDADWLSSKSGPTINIYDFARQLLESLRHSPHTSRTENDIVFVAHSMGGLVIKQAYVLARQDPSMADLARRMKAMVFMGTPHRGSDLAQTLNNILRSSSLSVRSYIANLTRQNELLALLNDSFRHYANDVTLFSFYESHPTDLYIRSEVIVPKESAILGYTHERYAMLDADHRRICKFESPSDHNYVFVRNTLRSVIDSIVERTTKEHKVDIWQELRQIESFLGMPSRPDDDLEDVEAARVEGSCEWLADNPIFQRWVDPGSEDRSMVYWLSARPATGKSVLSGYVINFLDDKSIDCSYYFFRHGDKDRSTMSGFLRSLLYQMALRSTRVRQQLMSMIEQTVRFNKDDSNFIWRNFVWPIIAKTSTPSTIHYWVLDALDECSGFDALFAAMSSITPQARIRILITSRKLPEISQRFGELQGMPGDAISVFHEEISLKHTEADIHLYLKANRHKLHVGSENQKDEFILRILEKSEGCFLWVRFVLDELASAWSIHQVMDILNKVPQQMDPLYTRALTAMSSKPSESRTLIRAILTWIVCAARPLTVAELSEALRLDEEYEVPELESAVVSLCAGLAHVDKNGRATIVHLTARTFLTDPALDSEFRIDENQGHLRLATCCLKFLCSDHMRLPRGRRGMKKQTTSQSQTRSPFAAYACLEFAEHLRRATSTNNTLSSVLHQFLGANILSWIEYVAAAENLPILKRTANSINTYLQRCIQSSPPPDEFVRLAETWVVDLHRIVAGFGSNLLTFPRAIYWLIPPFCPKSSAVAATAGSRFSRITVKGLKNECWNDRISCIDSHEASASAVACANTIFAVGYSRGSVILHHCSTCLPWKTLEHGGPVRHLLFNGQSTHLISAGQQDIKVWDVDSGSVCWDAEVPRDIMTVAFTEDEKTVMVADKTSTFTAWSMQSGKVERTLNWAEKMPFPDEGTFRRPPQVAALSPDASLLGIVYRGRPVCLYEVEEEELHGVVSRVSDHSLGSDLSPIALVFNKNRDSPTLAVAYEDGDVCLFDYEELTMLASFEASAHLLACSPDGLTLVTGNSNGMVQLLEFETLRLIYRVDAADHGVRGLSFSPDGQRFMDVRGSQCNVWEPAVLLGMAKRAGPSAEPAEREPVIKGTDGDEVEITSIQLHDSEDFFFVGRSDGSVSLFDTASGEERSVLYKHTHQISVTNIVWGSQKRILASSDTASRFKVFALTPDSQLGWDVKANLIDRRANSMVIQLLLDPSNNFLLVSTEEYNSVWDLRTGQMVRMHVWQPPPSFCWINHPKSPAHHTLITKETATNFEWESPDATVQWAAIQTTSDEDPFSPSSRRVKNVSTFAHGEQLVVELALRYEQSTTDMLVFSLPPTDSKSWILQPAQGFNEGLGKKIRHVIGGYGSRLVFLDSQRWVCSVDAGLIESRSYVRHFPVPSDWQNQQRKLLMAVTRKGEILFVRQNEVAIISRGLEFGEKLEVGAEGGGPM